METGQQLTGLIIMHPFHREVTGTFNQLGLPLEQERVSLP